MRVLRSLCLWALLVPCLALGTRGARADSLPGFDRGLARAITQRLAQAGITKRRYGVAVLERGTGRLLVLAGQAQPLVPASVAKVLTAAAALDHLGPGYRLRTVVFADGAVEDGVFEGDLVVEGGADPTLAALDGDRLGVLRRLARQVRAAGIARVTGDLVLDDRLLDRVFTHPDWPEGDTRHAYGAGVAALSLNEGCLVVEAEGARVAGARATLSFPTTKGPWRAVNKVETAAGGKPALGGTWRDTRLVVGGRVPAKSSGAIRVPVPDPVRFFGTAFAAVLREEGVVLGGSVARRRGAGGGGREIARHESALDDVLEAMNVWSRNTYASTLFKLAGTRVAGVGTWASGQEAVRRMAEARGIAAGGTRIVDGSGLSPTNRVTAGLLAQVLHSFDRDPLRGALLRRSLPVAGVSGTLRRRLRDLKGRVHAKTGTLNDVRVRSLAGYVDGGGKKPGAVFAIVLRGRGANHAVIDDLVRAIDGR